LVNPKESVKIVDYLYILVNLFFVVIMASAQGALEYILLIGGAILVAIIAIAVILSITTSSESETETAFVSALCSKYPQRECDGKEVDVRGNTFFCRWTTGGCRGGVLVILLDGVTSGIQKLLQG